MIKNNYWLEIIEDCNIKKKSLWGKIKNFFKKKEEVYDDGQGRRYDILDCEIYE